MDMRRERSTETGRALPPDGTDTLFTPSQFDALDARADPALLVTVNVHVPGPSSVAHADTDVVEAALVPPVG